MDRLDIRTAVRQEIGEPTEGYWLDDQLNRYINDGIRDLQSVARVFATTTLNYAAGVSSASLPADYYDFYAAKWKGNSIKFLRDLESGTVPNEDKGEPLGFIISDMFYIWPIPSTTGTVTLAYFKKLASLDQDSHAPGIDDRWHTLLVDYAAGRAKLQAGEVEGPMFMAQYAAGKGDFARERLEKVPPVAMGGTTNILDFPNSVSWPLPFNRW